MIFEQTPQEIEQYLRSVTKGDLVAIRDTMGGMTHLSITKVTEVRSGRVYTEEECPYPGSGRHGPPNAWYMKSGKSCNAPTGQSRLVIPTQDILALTETPVRRSPYDITSDELERRLVTLRRQQNE